MSSGLADTFSTTTTTTSAAHTKRSSVVSDESRPNDDSKVSPETGFWKRATGVTLAEALRAAAFYQLYAVGASICVSTSFMYYIIFRIHLPFLLRFALVVSAPGYFCLLAVVNCVVLTVLFTTRQNLARLEETLANVADAITAPVLRVLPSFSESLSLDDLRRRLLAAARIVKDREAPVSNLSLLGIASAPITLSSRLVLNAAVRAVLFVVEARYGSALRAGQHKLNIATIKRILSGELVSLLCSPFSATIHLYIIVTCVETFALALLPFLIAIIFARRAI
jgi:hypothetical protein